MNTTYRPITYNRYSNNYTPTGKKKKKYKCVTLIKNSSSELVVEYCYQVFYETIKIVWFR